MKFLLTIIFLAVYLTTFGQVDTIDYRPYNSSKTEMTVQTTISKDNQVIKSKRKKKKTKYTVDEKKANQKQYVKAQQQTKKIEDCKPCWLRYFNKEDKLLQEGLSYSDCALGKRTEYYPNGKVKVIRFYKNNDNNNWSDFPCSVADGIWTYYARDGTIEKTETYADGLKIE